MKKIFSIVISSIAITSMSFATDRIVAEGGQGGAFETINAAVAAAVSGDRILIYPKANGGHYSENITITNKSLQLLSALEGTRFKLSGDIIFSPNSVGLNLTIIQAHMLTGSNISAGISAPAGTRSKIVIMDNLLDDGDCNWDGNYYDVNIANNTLLSGQIAFRFGRVVGNSVTVASACAHGIYTTTDALASNDVNYIVGNWISGGLSAFCGGSACVLNSGTSQFFYIANNFMDTNTSSQLGIWITGSKTSTADKNRVFNNSIYHNGNANNWGLYTQSHNSVTEFFNNTIQTAGPAIYAFGSNVQSINDLFQYNYTNLNTTLSYNTILNDGTNIQGAVFTMNTTTGEVTAGPQINGGNPDNAHIDLDLTRNNAHCFGGSYSRENFTQTANGAVTTFVIAPRRVLAGQTINISADGFDR